MRRRKHQEISPEIIASVSDIAEAMTAEIDQMIGDLQGVRRNILSFPRTRTSDYITARKQLLKIKRQAAAMSSNVLETRKLFTEER